MQERFENTTHRMLSVSCLKKNNVPHNENKNVRVKEWLETVAYKLTAVRRLIFLPIALAHLIFFLFFLEKRVII